MSLVTRSILAVVLLLCAGAFAGENVLWYDKPAAKWEQEALPVGNGRLGAMVFGGVGRERIQFNEATLWIGDEIDTGAYQAFGDVMVSLDGDAQFDPPGVSNPSEHASPGSQTIEQSIDGDVATKWCIEHHGRFPIVWQMKMPAGQKNVITSYTITSAPDVPTRDPKDWKLLGSQDGKTWTLLDERKDVPVWTARKSPQTFNFSATTAYAFYRIEFLATHKATHFQVSEISLGGDVPKAGAAAPVKTDYRRELDIARGVHTVSYSGGGVHYRREYFASHPAGVMIFHFTADKPGSYNGTIGLLDAHGATVSAADNTLLAKGSLAGLTYPANLKRKYNIALDYEAQVRVMNEGGSIEIVNSAICLKNVNSFTIFVDGGTDFVQDRSKHWRGEHPHKAICARLDAAMKTAYEQLLADHVKDFQGFAGRVSLDLGAGDAAVAALPTDARLASYKKNGGNDPGLENLLFQYGRYLLISSSRAGSLPANLQGRWNQSNQPPWRCDYHTDINVQMNYWPAEAANLCECFLPYADWMNSIREVRKEATKEAFNTRGWTMRAENGIFGGSTWQWVESGSAWVSMNLWEHYAFTRDQAYLRDRAYPILKEVSEFWVDRLKALPNGTLVAPNGYSPEHGPREDGVSHDQQLIWEVFTNTIEAADALGVDREFRDKLAGMREKLLAPKIGKWGQLQEWMTDRDDPKDQHRHLSHLVALHPGRQISVLKTPKLAEAVKVSLTARGDGATGWSKVWKINLWARLLDGDHAHNIIAGWISGSVHPNLYDTCPPFQIDGNFGYAAAVCEMLLQSQQDEIHLLPALPKAWASGSVKGLRARGNFTVDMTWKDGAVTAYRIASPEPRQVKIRVNGQTKTIQSEQL